MKRFDTPSSGQVFVKFKEIPKSTLVVNLEIARNKDRFKEHVAKN